MVATLSSTAASARVAPEATRRNVLAQAAARPSLGFAASSASRPAGARKSRGMSVRVAAVAMEKMTWNPINNKFFETFSYLPPMTDQQIKAQIDYLLRNNYIPCIEFAPADLSYITVPTTLDSSTCSGTYKNSYWPMWKLPMFGCESSDDVMKEITQCKKAYNDCYVRIVGFDNVAQVQCVSFLVHRPPNATEHASMEDRRKM